MRALKADFCRLIEQYIKDPTEKDEVFNAIATMPAVQEKAKWAVQWMNQACLQAEFDQTWLDGCLGCRSSLFDAPPFCVVRDHMISGLIHQVALPNGSLPLLLWRECSLADLFVPFTG